MTPAQRFKAEVLNRDHYRCLRHGPDCEGELDAHHIILEKRLRNLHGRTRSERDVLRWDPAIGVTMCRFHHDELHGPYKHLSMTEIPGHALRFVADNGLEHLLAKACGLRPKSPSYGGAA